MEEPAGYDARSGSALWDIGGGQMADLEESKATEDSFSDLRKADPKWYVRWTKNGSNFSRYSNRS